MVHPDVVPGRSEIDRIGMVAFRPIAAGTIVWAPCSDCSVWSSHEFDALHENARLWLDEFGYWLDDGSVLLVCRSGYLFNHSCDANIVSDGLDFGVATRDIPKGTELTIDYLTFRNEADWTFCCNCRTRPHRVTARSEADPVSHHRRQRLLDRALRHAAAQNQSLACGLARCSKTYRQWRRDGSFARDLASICDARKGLGGPARSAYLAQEMARIPMPSGERNRRASHA